MVEASNVLVLMGGVSAEHPISVRSAATVLRALADGPMRVTTVGIAGDGIWRVGDFREVLARSEREILQLDPGLGRPVTLVRDADGVRLLALDDGPALERDRIDVVFPVLHGPGGEDGSVQGFLETLGVAYVGAGVTASAIAMDKVAMKTLCAGAGIAQTEFFFVGDADAAAVIERVEATFGWPCFVKPANLGSSVGITRAAAPADMEAALAQARRYDRRVLVERGINAREIEVALLGDDPLRLSVAGEIVAADGFYDFDSKYVDDSAGLLAPAPLDDATGDAIRRMASQAWHLIGGQGMARADFFVDRDDGRVYLNEINTIPGFTHISMYPRLWRESGLDTPELVAELLRLAVRDHGRRQG